MKSLIDRLIDFDNEIIKVFEEKHPRLLNLCFKIYKGKKFGYQFMDESGNIKGEYTVKFDDNRITYKKGKIGKVYMTTRIKESFVEDTLENYGDRFLNKPLLTLPGYMVKSFSAVIKGDIKLGKD